jgi:hypothetical protein
MSKKRFELLTDRQWELIEPLPEPKRARITGVGLGLPIGSVWKAFYGCFGPARHGGFFPRSISACRLLAKAEAVGRAGCVSTLGKRLIFPSGRIGNFVWWWAKCPLILGGHLLGVGR